MKELFKAADFIKSKIECSPEIGLVLGSGLGVVGDNIQESIKIPYNEIPGFPNAKVEGHAGCLVIGKLQNKTVIAMQGRFHYYEGHPMKTVILPIRVMKVLGAHTLIVTNAAGGVNKNFKPGDLMIIEDHINGLGVNPLIGENINELGPRFPDMSFAYDNNCIKLAEKIAKELKINIQKGVYYAGSGPSYETPAEIRMIRTLGADAVGMSTVPEVIIANHMNMKVLGISCITNMAAGVLAQKLNHQEVIDTADKIKAQFVNYIKQIITEL